MGDAPQIRPCAVCGARPSIIGGYAHNSKHALIRTGLRYGWQGGGDGCAGYKGPQAFCEPGSAPLRLKTSRLPANPFMVKIEGGKCKCMPPQVCDE